MSFGNIYIVAGPKNRDDRYNCDNIKGYMDYLKSHPAMCEIIGDFNQFIKPVFDIDAFDQDIDIASVKQDLNKLFPNKTIYYARRNARMKKDRMKYSYRFYVDGVKIYFKNLKKLCEYYGLHQDQKYDMSIYSKNRLLFLPLTTQKVDEDVPKLEVVEGDIFKCCASYVEQDFEDWNNKPELQVQPEPVRLTYRKVQKEDEEEDNMNDIEAKNKLKLYLDKLSPCRFDTYDTWCRIMFSIINVCHKHNISKVKCKILIHEYSSKSTEYNEDQVDKWIDANYNRQIKRCQEGQKVNGIPSLFEFIKKDDFDYYDKHIDRTYANVKKKFDKYVFKCQDPIGFININLEQDEINQKPFYILNRKELLEKFEELSYWEWVESKQQFQQKQFVNTWLKDPNKNIYNSVVFRPQQLDQQFSRKHFNLFKGFRVENLKVCRHYDRIQPILDHIRVILSKNRPEVYNFIIQYFAQMVKNPLKKTCVILMFKSKQGAGKNTIIDMIANGIIGSECAISVNNPERVFFGNFNSLLGNKILAICNEAGTGLRDCIDKMKDTATAPIINVEKKGKDPVVFDNYLNIVATTNNKFPVPIATDDRRICWIECSNEKCNNQVYFDQLASLCEDDEVVSSFYHYLCEEVDITISNFQKERPITEEYQKIQKMTLSNPIKFLLSYKHEIRWRQYNKKFIALFQMKDIYCFYKMFCIESQITPYNKDQFFYEIMNEDSKITKCTYHGNLCIRIYQEEFNIWINKFEKLDKSDELDEIDESLFGIQDDVDSQADTEENNDIQPPSHPLKNNKKEI